MNPIREGTNVHGSACTSMYLLCIFVQDKNIYVFMYTYAHAGTAAVVRSSACTQAKGADGRQGGVTRGHPQRDPGTLHTLGVPLIPSIISLPGCCVRPGHGWAPTADPVDLCAAEGERAEAAVGQDPPCSASPFPAGPGALPCARRRAARRRRKGRPGEELFHRCRLAFGGCGAPPQSPAYPLAGSPLVRALRWLWVPSTGMRVPRLALGLEAIWKLLPPPSLKLLVGASVPFSAKEESIVPPTPRRRDVWSPRWHLRCRPWDRRAPLRAALAWGWG